MPDRLYRSSPIGDKAAGEPVTAESIQKEFDEKFESLQKAIEAKQEEAASAETDEQKAELRKAVDELSGQVKGLQSEQADRLQKAEWEQMKVEHESLREALEKARTASNIFNPSPQNDDSPYGGQSPTASFWRDGAELLKASKGGAVSDEIRDRYENSLEKAMTEGSGSTGGFLVPPQISSEILELRQQDAVLRPLFSSVNINTTTLKIASVESGLVAGWVAELAEKPLADLSFAELSVDTFTAAGLAVTSNQLLRDSTPSIDRLINSDLARRLRAVEEVAFIDGSGINQPLGILNTDGVGVTSYDDGSPTVPELLDAIQASITSIYTDYFAAPDAIVMHPRTWAYIVKARESSSPTTYIVGPPGGPGYGRRAGEPIPGYGAGPVPRGTLFGVPVYCTANVPTDKGAGTESRIIVGAFKEGLVLDHESIRLASSEHVYFTSNQTIFRAEEQVGFTAARYPRAFNVVAGTGLAGV